MNLEQTTLRQATQKDNYCVIPPDEALEQSQGERRGGKRGFGVTAGRCRALEMGADSGCTTACEYLTPQNCPLRTGFKW